MRYILFTLITILGFLPLQTIARATGHSTHHSSGSHSTHHSSSGHSYHQSSGSHSTAHTNSTHTTPRYSRTRVNHADVHASPIPHNNSFLYYYIIFNNHTSVNDTIWGKTQDDVINQANKAFDSSEADAANSTPTSVWIVVIGILVIVGVIFYYPLFRYGN